MRNLLVVVAVVVVSLMSGGCGSGNFMVYKNGSNFYLTSNCPERKRIVCDSDEISKIVKDSGLAVALQVELKDAICFPGKEFRPLREILKGMTDKQISDLKESFQRNGYEINKPADT